MANRWSVKYRSESLPFGEFGADGLTELTATELYNRFVEKCRATGGTVELKRGEDVVASFMCGGSERE